MTPKDARKALKARRKAIRRELAAARRARKAAARRSPARRKRRLMWRVILLILLLILYLLLRGCDCECGPGGPFVAAPADAVMAPDQAVDQGPDALPPDAAPPKRRRRRLKARVKPIERPTFHNPRPDLEGWLPALRLQVSARGPRLGRCFEGSKAPGALRWRARVDVARGTVADHDFEPVLAGAPLTARLRRCLVGVLAEPPYRLPAPAEPGPPAQVSILIEF